MGSRAQIVGLQRAVELNGLEVEVVEEEEGEDEMWKLGLGDSQAMRKATKCGSCHPHIIHYEQNF